MHDFLYGLPQVWSTLVSHWTNAETAFSMVSPTPTPATGVPLTPESDRSLLCIFFNGFYGLTCSKFSGW